MAEPVTVPETKVTRLAWLIIGLTVFIFGLTLTLVTFHLRGVVRDQIVRQDGDLLFAATKMQQFAQKSGESDDPAELFVNVLEASEFREVIGVRLFSTNGTVVTVFPEGTLPGKVAESDLELLKQSQNVSHFRKAAKLSEIAESPSEEVVPIVEAFIPLVNKGIFLGAAEFIIDGENVAAAFADLDRHLAMYAAMLFLGAGFVLVVALGWAFGRLARANSLLAERTANLLRANHELTLSAKTSALGAVTAHLLHELKNPLCGLQTFVSIRSMEGQTDPAWQLVAESTQRMHAMITEVVRILQEENRGPEYELSPREVITVVADKLKSAADIEVEINAECDGLLSSKDGNLIVLIMSNLIQNAVQAMANGGAIELSVRVESEQLVFAVRDTGPGIPEKLRAALFTPVKSNKSGGTGVGLAISHELARHLGGDLLLASSSPAGSVFELRLPEKFLKRDATTKEALFQ
jgi:signal transduction histidine kinase